MATNWQTTALDEAAMTDLAARLATVLAPGAVIYLNGDLGAGKTTFSRGFLRGLGYHGTVKSPTYTLVEPYDLAKARIYHFDLYRLHDPEELELMGIRDYFNSQSIVLVEWPVRGEPLLPPPDLTITIDATAAGRILSFSASTTRGQQALQQLCS